ncbi:MAG: excinuclease ABC subunit UvrB, partial [Candidatus Dadabacteria bacterium]|nr:excinuclease ABC subunit UvrB [Candidatus Dadabacteria bacterium]NIS09658.1 excinuclease ABC subunit UvrB [Candidatus Dadabacteria bacterium]NIV41136.1 excinuclease ABC subunit UvrB [Candidatus Dadabacteria bacterium]NIX16129.1 excinuclease ABC subunit UvrB [Candidatus Dadabacteria bacterium]NIY21679.1 excinuclease ABC subunit UvrB [Candidatus Dadabacteria bacterium]
MEKLFNLTTDYKPQGDQPNAIEQLTQGLQSTSKHQVLLGVTGSGKTFTIANVVNNVERPTLIIAHNKTLAAQLYGELRELFPDNSVHYFVSYYDYYQPEAYIPTTDTYIDKDVAINETIDRLRHAATSSLFERRDIIIVSSVSCIYGIGSPQDYYGLLTSIEQGSNLDPKILLNKLKDVQYQRTNTDLTRGTFRYRGDVVEVFPSHQESIAIRIEFFEGVVESIKEIDPIKGKTIRKVGKTIIYPSSHYVAPQDKIKLAIEAIKEELKQQIRILEKENKYLEARRIEERTNYDLELLTTMGFCNGIENYSRHITGRSEGEPPWTLIDYFPEDFLIVIDESHQTMPQIRGMYEGDRSRKKTLVEYGFRLPSALDNRPLNFKEFEGKVNQAIYVSATPASYEITKSNGAVVEQIIRPTGLIDPEIEMRPAQNQVDDILEEIKKRIDVGDRVLITTLTKKMAEDLTEYYKDLGLNVNYLHSDIDALERIKIIRNLRLGEFDILIGINLLREGLDIPEVSLVVILDADKEGYLRSETSLIQVFGRAARNVRGKVILYADVMTGSMQRAINETYRRREIQEKFNSSNNITPKSIEKNISDILSSIFEYDYFTVPKDLDTEIYDITPDKIPAMVKVFTKDMKKASR